MTSTTNRENEFKNCLWIIQNDSCLSKEENRIKTEMFSIFENVLITTKSYKNAFEIINDILFDKFESNKELFYKVYASIFADMFVISGYSKTDTDIAKFHTTKLKTFLISVYNVTTSKKLMSFMSIKDAKEIILQSEVDFTPSQSVRATFFKHQQHYISLFYKFLNVFDDRQAIKWYSTAFFIGCKDSPFFNLLNHLGYNQNTQPVYSDETNVCSSIVIPETLKNLIKEEKKEETKQNVVKQETIQQTTQQEENKMNETNDTRGSIHSRLLSLLRTTTNGVELMRHLNISSPNKLKLLLYDLMEDGFDIPRVSFDVVRTVSVHSNGNVLLGVNTLRDLGFTHPAKTRVTISKGEDNHTLILKFEK